MKSTELKIPVAGVSPLFETFEALGDGWTFLILRESFFGARRFEQFRTNTGITRSRLAERLAALVRKDIFQKLQYNAKPPRYEYRLSEAGHDIYGMTLLMKRWGDVWRADEPKPSLDLVHKTCGRHLVPNYVCQHCKVKIVSGEVELRNPALPGLAKPNFAKLRRLSRQTFRQAGRNDSVARTLEVIGDHWTMALISETTMYDTNTYAEFIARLGISKQTLSSRLRHLVAEGIIERKAYQVRPVRHAYLLTEAGKDLLDIFCVMFSWGRKWRCQQLENTSGLFHRTCGTELTGSVTCAACNTGIHSHDVVYERQLT